MKKARRQVCCKLQIIYKANKHSRENVIRPLSTNFLDTSRRIDEVDSDSGWKTDRSRMLQRDNNNRNLEVLGNN